MSDYKINPYATIGGGLAGLGLGGLSYLLGLRKSKAKLLAHLLIGTGLGAGAGALASLSSTSGGKDSEYDAAKNMSDAELERIAGTSPARRAAAWGAGGGVTGYSTSRAIREARFHSNDRLDDLGKRAERFIEIQPGSSSQAGSATPQTVFYRGVELSDADVADALPGRTAIDIGSSGDKASLGRRMAELDLYGGTGKLGRFFGVGRRNKIGVIADVLAALAGSAVGGVIGYNTKPNIPDGK